MNSIINAHNRKVLSENSEANERTCNCRVSENYPLNGACLATDSLYEATITSDLRGYKDKIYKGISEPEFKVRFKNHEKAFKHTQYRNDCALSIEYWRIKEKGGTPKVKWKLIRKCPGYNPQSKRCILCLSEKLEIAEYEGDDMLNKRSEIVLKCMHRNKFMLGKFDKKT